MNRRGFLQACLASATAPYVVTTAGVLMPVRNIIVADPVVVFPGEEGLFVYCWVPTSKVFSFLRAGWEYERISYPEASMELMKISKDL